MTLLEETINFNTTTLSVNMAYQAMKIKSAEEQHPSRRTNEFM